MAAEYSSLQPIQYEVEALKVVGSALVPPTDRPSCSLFAAEEAEKRRLTAERRRKQIYEEIEAVMGEFSKGLQEAEEEYKRTTAVTMKGVHSKILRFFERTKKEFERVPPKLPMTEKEKKNAETPKTGAQKAVENHNGIEGNTDYYNNKETDLIIDVDDNNNSNNNKCLRSCRSLWLWTQQFPL